MSLKKYVRGCVSLKKCKSQDKALQVTFFNRQEENSEGFSLNFVQELGLRASNVGGGGEGGGGGACSVTLRLIQLFSDGEGSPSIC